MSGLINFINLLERLNNSTNILERSLQEDTNKDKPCEAVFVSDLDKVIITNEHIDNNLSCAICQDPFILGDKCIKLPCGDPHYFHFEADPEICQGILPWFKNNNTCPICRREFPEETNENSDEPGEQQGEQQTEETNEEQDEQEQTETNENPDEQATHNETDATTLQDMVHRLAHELSQRSELFNMGHMCHIHHPVNMPHMPHMPHIHHPVNMPQHPFNIGNIVYIPIGSGSAAPLDNDDDNNINNYDTDLQEAIRRSFED